MQPHPKALKTGTKLTPVGKVIATAVVAVTIVLIGTLIVLVAGTAVTR